MVILGCDHCRKQSPDAEGHRIADFWVTVTLQTQAQRDRNFPGTKVLLCDQCFPLLGTEVKVVA